MSAKQIAMVFLFAITGVILALLLNLFVIENILIPDPCYYHTHDTNKIFDVFYKLTAEEGYHPFPTKFNFIFTASIGALLGGVYSIQKLKRRQASETLKTQINRTN